MNQQEFNIQNDSDAENAESMTASDAENTAVTPDTSTAETKAGTFYEETETSKNEHYDTPEKPKRRLRSASNTARHKKKASHILLILFIILTAALLCCLIGTGLFLYRQNQTVQTLSLEVERYNSELEQKNAAQSELEAQISLLQETIAQSEAGKMNDLPEIPFSVDLNQWNYVLVNELNLLPQEYETTLKKVQNNQYVDERIVPDLEEMMKDAAKANCPL